MRQSLIRSMKALFRSFGIDVVRWRPDALPPDIEAADGETLARIHGRTMTSPERVHSLVQAVRHVCSAGIEGPIVECGVWRGGSMMAAALTLLQCGDRSRDIYLFDTFAGMTAPTAHDVDLQGQAADALLSKERRDDPASAWCYATEEDVRSGLESTGYPMERVHFVKGKVEDTIPGRAPDRIAILRLDTDWYESTRHELEHLYPRLLTGGVLLIDDYGHWEGCRKAVDEYFSSRGVHVLLNRIDYSGRVAIKPSDPSARTR
jgi:O-methyltransferase